MPSAKETLDKIAQAIGIATATPEVETVDETVETIETPEVAETEETVSEAVDTTDETVESTDEATDENTEDTADEATEATPEVEAVESNDEPEAVAEDKSDDRVKELEAQLADLKKILEDSINKTEDAVEAPELPVKEDEGLTHSPEAEVAVKRTKIGNKGGSIMSNVFKYINN